VRLRPAAQRELRKLTKADAKAAAAVRGAIELLAADPRPPAFKPLVGSPYFRVRVGDYRIVYLVEDGVLLITVITLGHRREVYR
jgi:mRNA interferase RelE/StbE